MKRLICLCVAVSGILFFASAVGMDVPDDANDIEPLTVGQSAPRFTVYHADGRPYVFDPLTLEKPVVLIAYRGGWCPYCNMHLKELRDAEPRLLEMGFEVIFLSTDRPEILYASLFDWAKDINYTLLSDSKMEASKALGIAFRMEESDYERLKSLGIASAVIQQREVGAARVASIPAPLGRAVPGEDELTHSHEPSRSSG